MRTPSIAPDSDEQDIYLVLDDFGTLGRAWRETDERATDFETLVTDLLSGQCTNPIRIVSFNIADDRARDASADLAREVRRRIDLDRLDVSESLADFLDRYEGSRQLTLRLA